MGENTLVPYRNIWVIAMYPSMQNISTWSCFSHGKTSGASWLCSQHAVGAPECSASLHNVTNTRPRHKQL